jgi:SNF2 family DNA or RNA helicase
MQVEEVTYSPGERINHSDYGAGIVLEAPRDGYLRAFFSGGERRVPVASIQRELSRTERILRSGEGTAERARKVWLSYEAHALPAMESASALTSARIDLLPHQVVLTHRIATASPRRFLIADEVGLGKTIEAGLAVCQLWAERKRRILIMVPASLRKQWAIELEEKFNLPAIVLDAKTYRQVKKGGNPSPFHDSKIVITSLHFASRRAEPANGIVGRSASRT